MAPLRYISPENSRSPLISSVLDAVFPIPTLPDVTFNPLFKYVIPLIDTSFTTFYALSIVVNPYILVDPFICVLPVTPRKFLIVVNP